MKHDCPLDETDGRSGCASFLVCQEQAMMFSVGSCPWFFPRATKDGD
jgi:hypothetical protein